MKKTVFVIGRLAQILHFNDGLELPLSWWDGMIGALPVFSSREKAEAYVQFYVDGGHPVFGVAETEMEFPEVQ